MAEASPPPARRRVRAIVHGRVQGVSFRYFARLQAEARRLSGYARNRDDGTLEVVAQGRPADVEAFVQWLRQGPRLARVTRVDVSDLAPVEDTDAFEVRG